MLASPIDYAIQCEDIKQQVYLKWIKEIEAPARDDLIRNAESQLQGFMPVISIVMPTYNSNPGFLHEAIQSLLRQGYPYWQLCIVDDASERPWVEKIIRRYQAQDTRINARFLNENIGIAGATNRGLKDVRGQYVGFLDHDDVLAPHALLVMAAFCCEHRNAELVYSDSDSLDASGQRCEPFFKPDWNYELLLGQNYLNHLCLYNSQLVKRLGGLRDGFQGSQDFDLVLRVVEALSIKAIAHVPEILYHWRTVSESVSRANIKSAIIKSRAALEDHLHRTGQNGKVCAAKGAIIYNRVKWQMGSPGARVGVLVYGLDAIQNQRCVNAIKRLCKRQCVSSEMSHVAALSGLDTSQYHYWVRPLLMPPIVGASDLGEKFNRGVQGLDVDILCFFSAAYTPHDFASLEALVAQAQRPTVGAVSAKCRVEQEDSGGYFSRRALDHQVAKIQGPCFATSKSAYGKVGGFDRRSCDLKSMMASYSCSVDAIGLRIIWSAQAEVVKNESLAFEGAARSVGMD